MFYADDDIGTEVNNFIEKRTNFRGEFKNHSKILSLWDAKRMAFLTMS